MKRQDVYLIIFLAAAAAAAFLGFRLVNQGAGEDVVVYIGEEEYARLPLDTDAELVIESSGGGENRLVVQGGYADVTEATCPDLICVRQSPISQTGETIVCMPNRVIVTIEKRTQNKPETPQQADGVSGSRGIRQMEMQAFPLGSLLAEVKGSEGYERRKEGRAERGRQFCGE